MGGGSWDTDSYHKATASRAASGTPDFDYDVKVKSGKASGIHASLDPKKVAGPSSPLAGQNVRESRDSDEHPESLPIAVFFDVTGSMGQVPKVLQKKLASLMDIIIAKAGVLHPQVLVGGIGDASPGYRGGDMTDTYPFQVGQFESSNLFDEQLRSIILEGGGGGQNMESYGLAYRFAAHHTASDSWEKRGKKGYLFTIGDEAFWPTLTSHELKEIFDLKDVKDESVEELYRLASEQWEIFHLFAAQGSYATATQIHDKWKALLGERFVWLDNADLVCEVIAGLIYMLETSKDATAVVDDIGLSGAAHTSVKNALVPVSKGRVPAGIAKGKLPKKSGSSGGVTRL